MWYLQGVPPNSTSWATEGGFEMIFIILWKLKYAVNNKILKISLDHVKVSLGSYFSKGLSFALPRAWLCGDTARARRLITEWKRM